MMQSWGHWIYAGVVLVMATLCGCTSLPEAISPLPIERDAVNSVDVYVVSHGWHTGLVLPMTAISESLPELHKRFPNVPYLEFGWGDKGFYQAHDITPGLAMQALFVSPGSVLHVVAVPRAPADYFSNSEVIAICLSPVQMRTLRQFIIRSFVRSGSGQLVPQQLGIYGDSQFYLAEGRYHLFNTCNSWTARGLFSAGLAVPETGMLTAGSVVSALRDMGYSSQNRKLSACY